MSLGLVVYLLFLLATGVLWVLFPVFEIFLFFMMLILLFVVDVILSLYAISKSYVSYHLQPQATRNERVALQITRHSSSSLVSGKTCTQYQIGKVGQVKQVKKTENLLLTHAELFLCNDCGNYEIEIVCEYYYDMLHIFYIKRNQTIKKNISILPKRFVIHDVLQNMSSSEDEKGFTILKAGDDLSEIHELRKYREGDMLKQIHWNASLKRQEIIVKEGSKCSDIVYTFGYMITNNSKENNQTLDVLHSICLSLIEQQIVFYIAIYNPKQRVMTIEAIDNAVQYYQTLYQILSLVSLPFTKEEYGMALNKSKTIALIQGKTIQNITSIGGDSL